MIPNESTLTNGYPRQDIAQSSLRDCPTERELIATAQAGMADAMNELLVRHRSALYRAARRFTESHEDAEDLVQDAMMRAFINVGRFRNDSQFATWLIAILNNAALSMKRKAKRAYWVSLDSPKQESSGLGSWDMADSRLNPEQEAIQRELLALLRAVLLRQSELHQVILKHCVFNESRIDEVASSLGITIPSAKSNLYRARRRVSESFARRGLVKKRSIPKFEVH